MNCSVVNESPCYGHADIGTTHMVKVFDSHIGCVGHRLTAFQLNVHVHRQYV